MIRRLAHRPAGRAARPAGRLGPGAAHRARGARRAGRGRPVPPAADRRARPGDAIVEVRGLSAAHGGVPGVARHRPPRSARGEIVAVWAATAPARPRCCGAIAGVHAAARGRRAGRRPRAEARRRRSVCARRSPSRSCSPTPWRTRCASTLPRPRAPPTTADAILLELGIDDLAVAPSARPVGRPTAAGRDRGRRRGRAPVLLLDEPTRGTRPGRQGAADPLPARSHAARRRRRRLRHPRRGARGGRGDAGGDARRRRSHRRRRPGDGPGRLPSVRAADDAGVRSRLAHARAGRGGVV